MAHTIESTEQCSNLETLKLIDVEQCIGLAKQMDAYAQEKYTAVRDYPAHRKNLVRYGDAFAHCANVLRTLIMEFDKYPSKG